MPSSNFSLQWWFAARRGLVTNRNQQEIEVADLLRHHPRQGAVFTGRRDSLPAQQSGKSATGFNIHNYNTVSGCGLSSRQRGAGPGEFTFRRHFASNSVTSTRSLSIVSTVVSSFETDDGG